MTSEFFRFLLVGGVGFVVDAGGTWVLTLLGTSPFVARIPTLTASILVTWLLNRSLTFRVDRPGSRSELVRYVTVALSSALMNFLIYGALVLLGMHPVVAIAIATVILLLYTFFAYRHMVFR